MPTGLYLGLYFNFLSWLFLSVTHQWRCVFMITRPTFWHLLLIRRYPTTLYGTRIQVIVFDVQFFMTRSIIMIILPVHQLHFFNWTLCMLCMSLIAGNLYTMGLGKYVKLKQHGINEKIWKQYIAFPSHYSDVKMRDSNHQPHDCLLNR